MKKFLILFLLLNLIYCSQSQTNTYHHFPSADAMWRESSGGYQSSNCRDYQYTISGDTSLNNNTYHQLHCSGVKYLEDQVGNCTQQIFYYFNFYIGAFREDTILKRVYFLPDTWSHDTLLYDFNLNIGDTLPPGFNNNPLSYHNYVSSVDSVYVGGNYRKRFGISSPSGWQQNYVYLIEGIGSTFGLVSYLCVPFEVGSNLKCFTQHGSSLYPDSTFNCDIVTAIEPVSRAGSKILIKPNPFVSSAGISFDKVYHSVEIGVYNIIGEMVDHQLFADREMITFNVGLKAGMYFLRIRLDNNVMPAQKVIIQN